MHIHPYGKPRKLKVAALALLAGTLCHAQLALITLSGDAGTDQLAEGMYVKPAAYINYFKGDYAVSAAMQMTFSSADRKTLSGYQASVAKQFRLREFPFSISLFAVINPWTDLVREVNAGVLVGHHRDHLLVQLGNASRVYGLKKKAFSAISADPDPSLRIIEYRNFTYKLMGYLKKMDAGWNLGAGVTNMDNFRVQQETNPMFVITGYTRLLPALNLNADVWLQGAGMTNLAADFYGWYGRIALTWMPGSNK
jgi:hypothetical protein